MIKITIKRNKNTFKVSKVKRTLEVIHQGRRGLQGIQGEKGDTGEQGLQGIPGDLGPVGPIGPQGPKGDKGDKGEKGNTGLQGPQGNKGDKGDQGEVGPRGPQGFQGTQGPTGPQGPKGDKGNQGLQGPQGEQGEPGDAGDVQAILDASSGKTTPVNGDRFPILDSEASDDLKNVFWSDIKATLKTYNDTLYAPVLGADDNYVTDAEKVKLSNLSGVNSGDQDLSPYLTIAGAAASYQPLDSDLTTIAANITAAGHAILDDASASAQRTTLGLEIGTNVQAWDADLDTLASLTPTTNNFIISVGSSWASRTPSQALATLGLDSDLTTFSVPASTTISAFGATLVDDADAATGRGTLSAASRALDDLSGVAINTALLLGTSDGGALGSGTKMWSDLFLASGGVINFNNGNVTLTHSAGVLTADGAALVWNEAGADLDMRFEGDTNVNLFFLDASVDKIGFGTSTPAERLEVIGNFQVTNAATSPARGYRFRTSGTGLDVDGYGGNMYWSIYSAGNYTGTQQFKIRLGNGSFSSLSQLWEWKKSNNLDGTTSHLINADGGVVFNEQGDDYDIRFEGDTDANNFFSDASVDRIGIGTNTPLSKLDVSGSFGVAITSTSTSITLDATHHTVKVDASGAARTITLPAAASFSRRIYVIKKIDSSGNAVTVDGNASETIDGATTYSLASQWKYVMIQSDGTNWMIIANN